MASASQERRWTARAANRSPSNRGVHSTRTLQVVFLLLSYGHCCHESTSGGRYPSILRLGPSALMKPGSTLNQAVGMVCTILAISAGVIDL